MTTYAGRYGSGPQIKPGSMALALAATVLPIVGLVAGLQIDKIIHKDKPITIVDIKDPPPPPPDPATKDPPKQRDDPIFTPRPQDPIIPPVPQVDPTLIRPSDPPDFGTIGKLPDPTPTVIEPVKAPVIVGVQIASPGALQPPYPAEEQRAGREGRVVVRVLVGTDGRVKQVEKISAASDAFYAATERQALGKWRFKPATKDGVPFEQWKLMSLRFVIDDQ